MSTQKIVSVREITRKTGMGHLPITLRIRTGQIVPDFELTVNGKCEGWLFLESRIPEVAEAAAKPINWSGVRGESAARAFAAAVVEGARHE